MRLIGVTGLARSGKDHASNYLAKYMALHKYAFAEPLKTMLKSVFGDHFHEGDRTEICPETCKSYRVMMQTLGTEWGRDMMNPQVWINLVEKRRKEVEQGLLLRNGNAYRGMVLSDVRFDSEAEYLQHNSAVILHIIRPDQTTVVDKVKSAIGISGHISEKGISPHFITHTIVNDGSLFELDMKLMNLVSELEGH